MPRLTVGIDSCEDQDSLHPQLLYRPVDPNIKSNLIGSKIVYLYMLNTTYKIAQQKVVISFLQYLQNHNRVVYYCTLRSLPIPVHSMSVTMTSVVYEIKCPTHSVGLHQTCPRR